jgi:hypothetical protein
LKPEIDKGVQRGITYKVYASASASISPIRATAFYIFLTTKRQATATSFACFNLDTCFIDKIHNRSLSPENGAKKSPVTDRAFIHLL